MAKTKNVKCKYTHCKHPDVELPKEEMIRVGNWYYHPDCYKEKETIQKIIDIYQKYFEENPIFTQLRSVINDIIYKKKVDSQFFLFAIIYAVNHHKVINHPPGLYYLVKNEEILAEWNRRQYSQLKKEVKKEVVEDSTAPTFTYKPKKQKTIADILMEG